MLASTLKLRHLPEAVQAACGRSWEAGLWLMDPCWC
jgi:hypothetical protein